MPSNPVTVRYEIYQLQALFKDVADYLTGPDEVPHYLLGVLTEMGYEWRYHHKAWSQGWIDIHFASDAEYVQFKLTHL